MKHKGAGAPPGYKGKQPEAVAKPRLKLAAIGFESEFALVIDGVQQRPEDIFKSPRAFLRGDLVHRIGTSYHLPGGGAVYFDTGVIEVVTPVIEIEPECAARAGRSLWEAIEHVRREMTAWEERTGHRANLVGFSTHYNISFDVSPSRQGSRSVEKLALLLTYLLPAPVMLLATNRRSTGVGVRPRGDRIEVTLDFTPSASLMIATGALITGIVRSVMKWPSFELDELDRRGFPVISGFTPMPHTSRKGWLARYDCYPENPFTSDINEPIWNVHQAYWNRKEENARPVSLRHVALHTFSRFRTPIRNMAGRFTYRLIRSVLSGRTPSMLDMEDRPAAYEDVGRLCAWDNLFPEHLLSRSRYERVLMNAIAGRHLWLEGTRYTPLGLHGWSEVVFRRDFDKKRVALPIDFLLQHLDAWEHA